MWNGSDQQIELRQDADKPLANPETQMPDKAEQCLVKSTKVGCKYPETTFCKSLNSCGQSTTK